MQTPIRDQALLATLIRTIGSSDNPVRHCRGEAASADESVSESIDITITRNNSKHYKTGVIQVSDHEIEFSSRGVHFNNIKKSPLIADEMVHGDKDVMIADDQKVPNPPNLFEAEVAF